MGRHWRRSVYSFRVLSQAAATQPPGPSATAPAGAGERYGPNTAEVTAFIESVGRLSQARNPSQVLVPGPVGEVDPGDIQT